MIVKINIENTSHNCGNVAIDLVDVWYKSNYWTTDHNVFGIKTGAFDYYQGNRKIVIFDNAGTDILHINDITYPPYHITDALVKGRVFYRVKNKILRYGDYAWFHRVEDTSD